MKPATFFMAATLISSGLLSQGLLAAEWQREAGVTLGAYVSDNICLRNNDHKARGAGTATPDISLRGLGARARLYLEAAVEYNSLADSNLSCFGGQGSGSSNRNALVPSLRYRGDLDLVDDFLTLESDAFAGRNAIDPFEPGSTDSFNGRDNINITYQYGAGAVIRRRFFEHSDMLLRYRHSEQFNEVNRLGDSSEDRAEFDLGTERSRQRFTMGLAGRYSKVMNEGSESSPAFDNTLSSAEVRATLQLSSSWQVNGMRGEEWNEYTSARPEIDGSFWDAGLRWSPNERVEVNIGTGERFFGTTPRMSIRYRHRQSEVSASYARSLIFPRDLRVADEGFDDPFAPDTNIGAEPDFGRLPGDPVTLRGEPTFIGNTPIINERLNLRYRFTGRRSTLTLSASDSRQQRTEDLAEATFSDLGLTVTRFLTASLSANARLSWREREGEGASVGLFGQQSETWRAALGLTRLLGVNTTMSMVFQHTWQESDAAFNEFSENRITVSARHQF